MKLTLSLTGLLASSIALASGIQITDHYGQEHQFDQPVTRVVSLAPSLTELMFEVGAGDLVLGAVEWSNYPEEAKAIPRIGNHSGLNIEEILALQPEVVLYIWDNEHTARLQQLGLRLVKMGAETFDAIAGDLRTLSLLTGQETGLEVAEQFAAQIAEFQAANADKEPVTGFVQVSPDPIFTVADNSFIGAALNLCGIDNIFGDLEVAYPQVNTEAVVAGSPQLIIALSDTDEWLADWRAFSNISAVSQNHLYHISPDDISRPVPGIVRGIEQVCALADQVRQ